MSVDPLWFMPLFLIFFAAIWLGVTHLISRAAKWPVLEERFPDRPETETVSMRMQSGMIKSPSGAPVTMSGCLRLEICPTGLRVSVWRIFAPFSSPVFVPWSQITPSKSKAAMFARVDLAFGRPEITTLIVSERTARIIEENSPMLLP